MRSLLHAPLDPACRIIRLALAEKSLEARLVPIAPTGRDGEPNADLAAVNPALTLPVLIDDAPTGVEAAVSPVEAIVEYLEEAYGAPALLPATSAGRAEARRLLHWFGEKYEREVNAAILRPRLIPGARGRGAVDPAGAARAADALLWHLDYLSWLLETRDGLSGPPFTVADIAGAAHLSAIDYFGVVPWSDFPHIKEWYQRIKSRPSFRRLLDDRLDGAAPAPHYANLDF